MKFRAILIVVAVVLLLIVVPVVFAQVTGQEDRQLQGTSLEETNYEEIYFQNNVQDLQLAGMLFLPEGDSPYPAVVIIHGSGTSRRENRWYVTLAHYLQENGIAVLLPDKRGSVHSEGDWRTARSAELLHSLNKDNIEVRIYEGSGHALEDPEGQGNDLIREEALHAIKEFIFSIE